MHLFRISIAYDFILNEIILKKLLIMPNNKHVKINFSLQNKRKGNQPRQHVDRGRNRQLFLIVFRMGKLIQLQDFLIKHSSNLGHIFSMASLLLGCQLLIAQFVIYTNSSHREVTPIELWIKCYWYQFWIFYIRFYGIRIWPPPSELGLWLHEDFRRFQSRQLITTLMQFFKRWPQQPIWKHFHVASSQNTSQLNRILSIKCVFKFY